MNGTHPLLTDVVIGTWISASLLDLLRGPDTAATSSRHAAYDDAPLAV